jgi:hypothetical protein
VQVEQLACCEPAGIGLQLTHWSTRALAQVARQRGIAPAISHSTVALILSRASLHPHRCRSWKTPVLDECFVPQAARVLWAYEQVQRLLAREEVVLCLDEKPNLQVLERRLPTRPARPHLIAREEFEYVRHGTVNFLAGMALHSGQMSGACLERNDSPCLVHALPSFLRPYRTWRRVHLIWDEGPSHTARLTREALRAWPNVRLLFTPPHASWLNQAELLLRAFSARYLERGDWPSRHAMQTHLLDSCPEYNRLFAHPFTWSWTRAKMHAWVQRHRER